MSIYKKSTTEFMTKSHARLLHTYLLTRWQTALV